MRGPRRLVVTLDPGEPDENVIEVMLVADGEGTSLVWEERALPLDKLAAYGAGIQIHVEDLAAHLAGVSTATPKPAVGRTPTCL